MIKTDSINTRENAAASKQVSIMRIIDAPRELVFKAWTTKEHLENWYAPNGCKIVITKFDLREGGIFLHRIEAPDGFTCSVKGVFKEINKPFRLVYTLAFADEKGNLISSSEVGHHEDWPNETTVTITFEEIDGKTKILLHQTVSELLAKKTGAYPSWLQMFDRLAKEPFTSDRELIITRLLDAPRELVFDAWTKSEHVGNWWGPNGFTITTKEMNVQPGGVWRYTMHGPDGVDYANKIVYKEVVRPERLVYSNGWDPEIEPDSDFKDFTDFEVTITFEQEGDKTRLKMHSVFASAEQFRMVAEKYGAIEGAKQHVARLEAYLPNM